MLFHIDEDYDCYWGAGIITDGGLQFVLDCRVVILPYPTQLTALPTNEDELPWADTSSLCGKNYNFVKLLKKEKNYFPMHSYRKDHCSACKASKDTSKVRKKKCEYAYDREDLLKALDALKAKFFPQSDSEGCTLKENEQLHYSYSIKKFENKDDEDGGYMKCFSKHAKYYEMRVIQEPKKLVKVEKNKLMKKHEKYWEMVSRCRFVFEYRDVSDDEKQGTLYFTDSHYGEDKIPKETLFKKACCQMLEDFIKSFAKQLKNDQCELTEILELLNDPVESMDAVNRYFQKFEELLKKIMLNKTHVAMQTLIRKLKKNLLAMDYFELFEKATKLRKYKYNLQEKLLEDLHKQLVNRLNKELDNNLQMLLNKPSQLKSLLNLNETKQIKHHLKAMPIVLKESVQYIKAELAKKNLQQLLHSWKGLEQKFDEKLKMLAQNQNLQLSNNEKVRVMMVHCSFETVKDRLINEGFYPFVEIGTLTIKRDCKCTLEWPQDPQTV